MDYQKTLDLWLNNDNLEKNLKEELLKMNEKDLKEAFYKELEFGTAGIRGIMGPGINKLNIYNVKKVALGFANYLKRVNKDKNDLSVAISYDNRINSKLFSYTCARVLAHNGIKVYITKDLRPTPYLSYLVRYFKADGGLMITASHNPKEYNGIKAYDKHGGQLIPSLTDILIEEVKNVVDYFNILEEENDLINIIDDSFDNIYLKEVYNVQLNKSLKKPYKFVYTPLHGAGGTLIKELSKETGYLVYPVIKQMTPDGNFTFTESSNPEDKKAFILGEKLAREINAEAVLVTDPDADRLAIAVKHNGKYIYLNGNQTVSLELYYLLNMRKNKHTLNGGEIYYSNVTTPILKEIAKDFNVEAKEVLTGFKFIGEAILNSENTFLFGAEESYGSLILPFVRDKDALQAVLLLMEMVTYYKNEGKSLYDVLLEIYSKYGYYSEKTLALDFVGIEGAKKIKEILKYYRNNTPKYLEDEPLKILDYLNNEVIENGESKKGDLPNANIIKFVYNKIDIIFRPSGTEPKIKIYIYVKENNLEKSLQVLEETIKFIKKEIEEI